MIAALITGFLLSFTGSMPPAGPVSLLVIRHGVRNQTLRAMSVASGAALAEAGYASVAYLGIGFVFSLYPLHTSIFRLASSALLIGVAVMWLSGLRLFKPGITEPGHAGMSFLLGLSIAGLNPTFVITWASAVAAARSLGVMLDVQAAPAFGLGVIAGPVLWFWILLKFLGRRAEWVNPESFQKVEKLLPIGLLVIAGAILAQAITPIFR